MYSIIFQPPSVHILFWLAASFVVILLVGTFLNNILIRTAITIKWKGFFRQNGIKFFIRTISYTIMKDLLMKNEIK
jgi:hypothetical protein